MVGAVDGFQGTSRFIVEGRLGEGGMGVVHRVRDVERGEVVALKTMTHLDAGSLLRFKREFRALADITHPNVVQLHEIFSEGDQWFFTMELVDGVDLLTWVHSSLSMAQSVRVGDPGDPASGENAPTSPIHEVVTLVAPDDLYDTLVPRSGRFDLEPPRAITHAPPIPVGVRSRFLVRDADRLRDAFRQLASGVQAIHAAGKLHRDIKPSNVMVTAAGRVVLLDFGVVGEYLPGRKSVRSDEPLVGTPAYMAPEQAAFQPATPASDWYAVGVILFESLTRRMPFEGSTSDLLLAKQRPLAAPPSMLVEGIPPDLESLCVDLLLLDPKKRPTGEDVLQRLEADRPTPISVTVEAPFVGRQEQLDALRAAFDASVAKDAPVVVMLKGRAGMGKSALASRFLGTLSSRPDVLVLSGRCYEREAVPFKAVDQVVDELSRWLARLPEDEAFALLPPRIGALARLFPVLRNARIVADAPDIDSDVVEPLEVRRRAFAALKDLLGAIAGQRALVIHIDDLQWGDADSVQLLEAMLSTPAPQPLLLVCDHRTEVSTPSESLAALRAMRSRLAGSCDFRDVEVGELPDREARELAASLLEAKDADTAAAIASEARGNPLFVAELARWSNARRAERADRHEPGPAPSVAGAVSLEEVVLSRVADLPDDARALLETVSLARGPLSHVVAERAAGLQARRRNAAITLRGARFVTTRGLRDDDLLETSHDRIRETIVASLDEDQRRARHLALARAIAASPRVDPESAYEHFLAAGDEQSAREYSLRAAEAADRGLAFLRAAALYRAAIALRAASLDLLHAKLGDALVNAGRGAEAADAYMEAAVHARRHEATDLQRTAAEHYLKSGRDEKGLAVLRGVLDEVGIRYPESTEAAMASIVWHETRLRLSSLVQRVTRIRRAQSLSPKDLARIDAAFCAATGLALRDPLRGYDFGLRALRLALESAEPVRLGRALAVAASNAATRGEAGRKRAAELVSAAQRVAAQVDDPHGHALAHLVAGMVHFFLGEWRSATAKLGEADQILRTRCRAVAWELAHTEAWTCNALILSGELRQASSRIPPALEEARARDDLFALTHLTYPACVSYILNDDVDAAWRVTQYATAAGTAELGQFVASCSVERYKGDGRAAWERVERVSPVLDSSHLVRVAVIRAFAGYERGLSAVASAAQGHDRARALRAAETYARRLLRENVPYAPPMGHLVLACTHAARGDRTRALETLERAIPLLAGADLGYLVACARHRRGELTGGAEGAAMVRQSRAFFEAQGVANVERCLAMSVPGF
ncbi:MAG TPA: AAA family ATPase [Polyangiaceae bacterium]|jgi:serine/threonine protein kinase|nr:AAA family ATPase [Polyangiaceae bacterium]